MSSDRQTRGRAFVTRALADAGDGGPEWFATLRSQGASAAKALGLPTRRQESWRFVDLSGLLDFPFEATGGVTVDASELEPHLLPEARGAHVAVVDGVYSPELSNLQPLGDSVIAGSLTDMVADQHFAVEAHLGHRASVRDDFFTALNTAHLGEGAYVIVQPDTEVAIPIHVLFISTGAAAAATHPRLVVVARRRAKVTVVEEYMGLGEAETVVNAVTEITVSPGARLEHTMVQRQQATTTHVGRTAVFMCNDANYRSSAITLGGKLARHSISVNQRATGMNAELNGLAILSGRQVADTHSLINHAAAHGTSRQLHKCIIDGQAHAVFNGKILVAEGAQQTSADQLNRNLLLSRSAQVDTLPQLEINADDVQCTHGSTVGQLDDEQVYYLQSRGFERAEATALLTYGFAAEVVDTLSVPSIRARLRREIARIFDADVDETGAA